MKKLFIAGNWKSNYGVANISEWLGKFSLTREDVPVILCVPFTLLYDMKQQIQSRGIPITLGAQNVSPFEEGAYTGEIAASQIKELALWVIIGHSERRKFFFETDQMLQKKVEQAKRVGLKIIYCVPDDNSSVPIGVDVIAYEPVWAIGSGVSDTPENANKVIESIKSKTNVPTVIYGGSVTDQNVSSFVNTYAIDGVLPGGASLDPEKFSLLIKAASEHS